MGMLEKEQQEQLEELFANLKDEVKLVFFTQKVECEFCKITRDVINEVEKLSGKITIEKHDFEEESELAAKYGVDKIPAVIVEGARHYGVTFFGVPAGYEFTSLIRKFHILYPVNHRCSNIQN